MKKQNTLNWSLTIVFLIALIVCAFFWKCFTLDLIVTIIAVVVAFAGSILLASQNKKIKELTEAAAPATEE